MPTGSETRQWTIGESIVTATQVTRSNMGEPQTMSAARFVGISENKFPAFSLAKQQSENNLRKSSGAALTVLPIIVILMSVEVNETTNEGTER